MASSAGMSDYERLRDARISENMARMEMLGLRRCAGQLSDLSAASCRRRAAASAARRKTPRPRVPSITPLRRSSRLRGQPPEAPPPGFVAGGGPAAALPKIPRPRGRPRKNPLPVAMVPSCPEMTVAATTAPAEENGSSQAAIARRSEAEAGGDLPASHPALVAAHLARMSAAGELVAVEGVKYALPPPLPPATPAAPGSTTGGDDDGFPEDEEDDVPDPDPVPPPPAKRGRGRPRKVRPPSFVGTAPGAAANPAAVPRRRGRPRKYPLPDGMAPRPCPGAPAATPCPPFAEVGFM
ncbi:hypothetical protein ACP4OV_001766 [Aristida adscensionis]